MPAFAAPANSADRARAFMIEYMEAARGEDVEVHAGQTEDGDRALIIKLGRNLHGFTLSEAGILADIFDDGLREFGAGKHTEGFAQIANAIRQSVGILNSH